MQHNQEPRKLSGDAAPANAEELQEKIDELMGPDPQTAPPTITSKSQPVTATAPLVTDSSTSAPSTETKTATAPNEPVATLAAEADDEVVDDIMLHDSDEILQADDEKLAKAFTDTKPSWQARLRSFFAAWWLNKRARYATFAVVLLLLLAVLVVPKSRYFVMNTVGIRASASLTVIDDETLLPLKNVQVAWSNGSGVTDSKGAINLSHLKLGASELHITKRGFATQASTKTVGWGSNPLGEFKLTATGTQYTITVTDWLSDKPVKGVEASSGEASALSDDKGKIILTVGQNETIAEASIKADGFRTETLKLPEDNKQEQAVKLVTGRKHVSVSKRAGKYDLYSIDVDGKNEKLVLAGTGNEAPNISLLAHPSDNVAALVSTRDTKRNADGYLLSTLTVIDLTSGVATSVVQSEDIRLIDWSARRLVYNMVAAGASAANPKRQRLMSYNYDDDNAKGLAATNYFSSVALINNAVYYAPSADQNASSNAFYRLNADGSNKVTILDKNVWDIIRTSYEKLSLSGGQAWYELTLGDNKAVAANGAPSVTNSRIYVDSTDRKHSLWVDNRDGKGVLLNYDVAAKTDTILKTQSGLGSPVRWLSNNTVVYRITTSQETADYVLNIEGGEPHKIKDVTNTTGSGQYYY